MKRKVLTLGVIGLLGIASAQAQWSVTPEIGMTAVNATEVWGSEHWNPSWRLGIGVEYQFPNSNWALSSGAFLTDRLATEHMYGYISGNENGYYYSYSGWGYGNSNNLPVSGEYHDTWNYTLRYKRAATTFYVPLMAKRYFPINDDLRLSVAAGPYVGYCFSNTIRRSESGVFPLFKPTEDEMDQRPSVMPHDDATGYFDWGFMLQTGMEIKHWTITAGYEVSLNGRYSPFIQENKVKDYFHTATLSIGYKFHLGK